VKVDCPTCGKAVEWCEESSFRPFCSDRCRLIDLGAWADETYTVPTNEGPDQLDSSSEYELLH